MNMLGRTQLPLAFYRWARRICGSIPTTITFAADLASHDIGNLWWPALDNGCAYYNYVGEYSYQTSSRIMDQANISYSDSDAMKIDKILAFINSIVHYEYRMIDHMWFPCETLNFRSGDCTSFSILAAAMFERAGIKSAIAFFTNSSMVLVHIDNLCSHKYWYYDDKLRSSQRKMDN